MLQKNLSYQAVSFCSSSVRFICHSSDSLCQVLVRRIKWVVSEHILFLKRKKKKKRSWQGFSVQVLDTNPLPRCPNLAQQHIFDSLSSLSKGIAHLIWNAGAFFWARLEPLGAGCEIWKTTHVLIRGQALPQLLPLAHKHRTVVSKPLPLSHTHMHTYKARQTPGSHCFDFLPDLYFPVQQGAPVAWKKKKKCLLLRGDNAVLLTSCTICTLTHKKPQLCIKTSTSL